MKIVGSLSAVAVCIALAHAAVAQEAKAPTTQPTVVVGGPAPALAGKYIKGEPALEYEPGKVYVMEFWATWCLPCKAAIPHLQALHEKYKDKGVVIIGQSVWEPKPEAAPAFVEQMGDAMGYRIALDHTDGEPEGSRGVMARTWLNAAGIKAIPSTWLVKDGKVLWMGHPKDLDEVKIDAALAGTFDIIKFLRENTAKSEKQKKQSELQTRFWDAVHDKDEPAVESAIEGMKDLFADRPEQLDYWRVRAYSRLGKGDQALAIARTYPDQAKTPKEAFIARLRAVQDLIVTNPKDPAFLAEVSKILDSAVIPETDNPKGAEAMVLKLRAWVVFLQGDAETAVKLQEQAISQMGESPLKPLEDRALAGYRAGKPPALIPRHSRDAKTATTKPAT